MQQRRLDPDGRVEWVCHGHELAATLRSRSRRGRERRC
jgi:hypothetical protein